MDGWMDACMHACIYIIQCNICVLHIYTCIYIYALRHPSASTHGASATFFSAITVPFDKGIQSHTRIPNPG